MTGDENHSSWLLGIQGCQIFVGPKIPKREKYTNRQKTIPNDRKLHQMAVKYSKWS
jgi:hypothetical protein